MKNNLTSTEKNPVVTAPVLIPYTPDCEYKYGEEVLPPEKIRQLANSFQQYKIIDLQHEYTKRLINKLPPIKRGEIVNSYISTEELYLKGLDGHIRKYPIGTWIITVKITDPEAMKLYYSGQLTGFSVTVKEKSHADAIMDYVSQKDMILPVKFADSEKDFTKTPKRILMKDVKDPVAFTVSLVRQPCVYGAKFCRKSCLIVNKDKLKENTINNMSLKERIKAELNTFIDGLDVEETESVKEDVEEVTESEKEVTETEESEKEVTESEKAKTVTDEDEADKCNGKKQSEKCNGKAKKIKKESVKEDDTVENEAVKEGENTDEDEAVKETVETENESEKSVLYLAQEDVEELIKTTLQRYAEEIEQLVFDGIQDALDEYEFAGSFKEDKPDEETEKKQETEEEEEEEATNDYATKEMVESIFEEQFSSFKSELMGNIKKAQQESIKSYSKAINPESDGIVEAKKGYSSSMSNRDVYGRRLRKK